MPFLPGPAGGLGGRLDANFAIVGTDPRTAQLGGTLALTEGRIPLAPAVGTLFHGDLKVGNEGTPHRKPPERPMFVANIEVSRTHVESKEVRGYVNGKLTVAIDEHEIGVVGNVWLGDGDLDLFDRRYMIDRAALHFDGSTDPVLDVRIVHDFPEVTTITEVHGRMSKPELRMSSSPPIYSQAELLGFLLGGEPGGDPNQAPSARDKVTGAGTSFVANQIGGYVIDSTPSAANSTTGALVAFAFIA